MGTGASTAHLGEKFVNNSSNELIAATLVHEITHMSYTTNKTNSLTILFLFILISGITSGIYFSFNPAYGATKILHIIMPILFVIGSMIFIVAFFDVTGISAAAGLFEGELRADIKALGALERAGREGVIEELKKKV